MKLIDWPLSLVSDDAWYRLHQEELEQRWREHWEGWRRGERSDPRLLNYVYPDLQDRMYKYLDTLESER